VAASDDPAFQDDGEKSALTLGMTLGADLILIDDRKGAAVALQKGFQITGTLGFLTRSAQRVSSVREPPLSGSGGGAQQVSIPGVTDEPVGIAGNAAGPEYFTAMGTAILRGRDFTISDSAWVAIVNEQMAHRFWGDAGRAIGQFMRVDGKDRQIVGVVETGKYQTLLEPPTPFFFLFTRGAGTLLIETAGDPAALADSVRTTFREAVPA
jgi:hypothetical protein